MKKCVCLLLALALMFVLCACGTGGGVSEGDLKLTLGGAEFTVRTTVADALAALGEDYAYSEAVSCVYTGMDKTYTYADATLYTYPAEDGASDCLMELYCNGGDVRTSRGIGLGDTRQAVIAAYGEGYTERGSILAYELPASGAQTVPASLYFELDGEAVAAIGITAEHRAE